ncbi:recombination regulator RecX [Clostridium akagii]|uniref:recombination regulator RecX n=1 Tax=Clostridium akagii TaxID=91623 RepID=UPI00047CBD51|nr:recombination regulator RecX [Clostridium akagii]
MNNKITKIEIQKRKKNRVNVFINEEFSFACSSDLVFMFGLKTGNEFDAESLKKIIEEDNYISCKNYALNVIDRSYKTEKEMHEKLVKKEYNEKVIERVFLFLKEYGFVDDDKYIDLYIGDRIKKNGKIKIKYDLLKKGVDIKLIDKKLNEVSTILEKTAIDILAKKKYESIVKTESNYSKIYTKLKSYLFRAGYNGELVNEILKTILKDKKESEENEEFNDEKNIMDLEKLKVSAEKRYDIIIKRESDETKIYKKLWEYLMRRGFANDQIKKQIREVMGKN